MKKLLSGCMLVWTISMLASVAIAEDSYAVAWSRQLGTSDFDYSYSIAIDGFGNAFVSGYTGGSLGGTSAGDRDAFLAKYDTTGNLLWTKQFGTSELDIARSVAIDGSGNAFITGYTGGSFDGTNSGQYDAFLAKYDTTGNLLWTGQLGTSLSERAYSIAVDNSGNAFISGNTEGSLEGTNAGDADVFLAKFDTTGNLLWTRQFGTNYDDDSRSIVVDDSGDVFISGWTGVSSGGTIDSDRNTFLAKYDTTGNLLWNEELGTSDSDICTSVAIDGSGNAFICGHTYGSLDGTNAGKYDAFLAKYDTIGNLLWTEQLGTSLSDYSYSVAVDGSGNAFISGYTNGNLDGTNAGEADAFLAKYDTTGNLLWTEQFGTFLSDYSYSVAVDGSGNAFIGGYTSGSLGGTNAGHTDAFLVKFAVPEPCTLLLFSIGGVTLINRKR